MTSFRQDQADWAKLRRYLRAKGASPNGRSQPGQPIPFSMARMFERMLQPVMRAIDQGQDPFPDEGRPLSSPEEPLSDPEAGSKPGPEP